MIFWADPHKAKRNAENYNLILGIDHGFRKVNFKELSDMLTGEELK